VARHLPTAARPGLTLLDVACGGGRHTRLGLERSYRVSAVDRDLSGVDHLAGRAGLEVLQADLEAGRQWPLAGRFFDVVVVTNYLWRPILPDIVASVATTGMLIYETFAVGHERFGRPSNPDFLLRPGELIEAVRGRLIPIAFEHGDVTDPKSPGQPQAETGAQKRVQRIVAVGVDHAAVAASTIERP